MPVAYMRISSRMSQPSIGCPSLATASSATAAAARSRGAGRTRKSTRRAPLVPAASSFRPNSDSSITPAFSLSRGWVTMIGCSNLASGWFRRSTDTASSQSQDRNRQSPHVDGTSPARVNCTSHGIVRPFSKPSGTASVAGTSIRVWACSTLWDVASPLCVHHASLARRTARTPAATKLSFGVYSSRMLWLPSGVTTSCVPSTARQSPPVAVRGGLGARMEPDAALLTDQTAIAPTAMLRKRRTMSRTATSKAATAMIRRSPASVTRGPVSGAPDWFAMTPVMC